MERGERHEFEAVRSRWKEIERSRRAANNLLTGLLVVAVGVLSVVLAVAATASVCVHGDGVTGARCVAGGSGSLVPVLGFVLGGVCIGAGAMHALAATREAAHARTRE
jgi:uncharacterized sodium:solute symporter family permease YidK